MDTARKNNFRFRGTFSGKEQMLKNAKNSGDNYYFLFACILFKMMRLQTQTTLLEHENMMDHYFNDGYHSDVVVS